MDPQPRPILDLPRVGVALKVSKTEHRAGDSSSNSSLTCFQARIRLYFANDKLLKDEKGHASGDLYLPVGFEFCICLQTAGLQELSNVLFQWAALETS